MSSKSDNSPGVRDHRPQLIVRGLTCRRGERTLFEGLDLDVASGEVVWLRAANGYGKTSLLRVLAGLAKPEAGTIEWSRVAQRVYLAHANGLKDDLTVEEALQHLVHLHALARSDGAIDDAMRRFGLFARRDAPIRTLSQGQRRRVALMRLCLSGPHAPWILDEPYDALDADGSAIVGELIVGHAAGGGLVLLTSHVPPAIAQLRTVELDAARAKSTP